MEIHIRPFRFEDETQVIALWAECHLLVPWNDPKHDIQCKMQVQPELFLVGTAGERIVATVMAGYDGHRGWLYYVAVSPEHQKQGIGRQIIEEAVARLRTLGCPKINLQVRTSNTQVIAFYERLGFKQDAVLSMGLRFVEAE